MTKYYIERNSSLYDWEPIAYPTDDNLKECWELCVKEEKKKRYPKKIRLVKKTVEVLNTHG